MNDSIIRKTIFTLLIAILYCNLCFSQTYVDVTATGNNDGTSWTNAYTNLQDAFDTANNGDQIWVATGTYLPGKPGAPKSTTFLINKGLQLYGGFAGTETKLSERNPSEFPTILSGDLNQDDIDDDFKNNRSDNVWTVMLVKNNTSTIPVIDGFTFVSGHADSDEIPSPQNQGGGLFTYGPIEIRHCIFKQNYASENGGALFFLDSLRITLAIENNENPGNESPLIIDSCHFTNNFAEVYGGALYFSLTENNTSKIYIGHSSFLKNKSTLVAGAIYSTLENPNGIVEIEGCDFKKNEGEVGGAVLHSIWSSNVEVLMKGCNFSENKSLDNFPKNLSAGGALRFSVQRKATGFSAFVKGCTFYNNTTPLLGGGISTVIHKGSQSTSITIDSCTYIKNEAAIGGGVSINLGGLNDSVFINACSFQNNLSVGEGGGAIGIIPRNPTNFTRIRSCTFSGNQTSGEGAAFYYAGDEKNYAMEACTFEVNQAAEINKFIKTKPVFAPYMLFLFFQGAIWLQIFYSLLIFFMTRERTTLYFTLLLVGVSALFFFMKDIEYFPLIIESLRDTPFGLVLFRLSVLLLLISLIKFTQHYLNINQYYPKARRRIFSFIIALLVLELVLTPLVILLDKPEPPVWLFLIFLLSQLMFFICFVMPFVGALVIAKKGFQPAKYLWPSLLLICISGVYLIFAFMYNLTVSDMYISQGFMLLALITIALANGYRTNLLKKDKARAKRLAELDTAKTRLYNNITHEFRTPLTVIMGTTEMLKGNEQEKELLQRNSKQLLALINQMLDLSKLEDGALKLEVKQGNVIPFIEYLVESFQSLAASKHIQLTFYTELEDLEMDYDAEKLQAIIVNLISNAIKFTPESGKVVLHAKTELVDKIPHLVLLVRDSGTGIPEKDIPHVFDRFFQVDASDMRRSEGSGIGLALVKELVQLMQGSIEVSSKLEKGSIFTVRIPITKEASILAGNFDRKEVVAALVSPKENTTTPSFRPLSDDLPIALIIEDNRDVVRFLRSCLQKKYKLEVAYNGQEGIEKALEIVPDVIISDVMMPEADGYTVCKTLKADERTSHIPIILLTAKATQQDKLRGLDMGADAYLSKPFHQEELELRLQKLIELRQALQSRYQDISNRTPSTANMEDAFVQKLGSIIEEKMEDESFSINELCRAVGLSRMQVHRKLKALTGMPASAFINSVRLQKGFELLSETNYNVSEVAYKVGYPDPSYFSRLFVKQFGKKPSEISKTD